MPPPTDDDTAAEAAGRLCAACGLCCNGVMFHTVKLQAGDSRTELAALGLKLKKKQKEHYILQPCPAFKENRCSIYLQRPTRCRLFECRQLLRLAGGEITEGEALEKIREAQARVETVERLLARSGKTDPKRALSKRYDKIVAEPLHEESAEAGAIVLRGELDRAMLELNQMLNRDFRLQAVGEVRLQAGEGGELGSEEAEIAGL